MKTLRIGLLWHTMYSVNLGVDALTRANIAILRAAAKKAGVKPQFVLLGVRGDLPQTTAPDPDVELAPELQMPRSLSVLFGLNRGFFKALKSCDIVFDICEGDSFSDIYGRFRFLFVLYTKYAVLQNKKPLVLSPQTIGPFKYGMFRPVVRYLMRNARMVYARDGQSLAVAKEMTNRDNYDEVIDVAFRLPFIRPERANDGKLRIGLNVSGLLFYAGERFHLTVDYAELTRRMLKRLHEINNAEVWLVPHVIGDRKLDDDNPAAEALQKEFPWVKVAPRFGDASEAKSFISGMDLMIGGRMHACIAAYSSGVPVIPVAYSRKFNGLFGTLKYPRVVDATALQTDAAYDLFCKHLAERDIMAEEIHSGLEIAGPRLAHYEDTVARLLQET